MFKAKYIIIMVVGMSIFTNGCQSQEGQGSAKLKNRQPAVAGRFYEGDPVKLNADLEALFSTAVPKKYDHVMAVISPHAGFVFSGGVAASSFNQIETNKDYDNIFILASSHRISFDGASVYNIGNYEMPLGTVEVNLPLANELIKKNEVFTFRRDAHLDEHSLEVQLPFLQYKLKGNFRIIPIVIGTQNPSTCKKIAAALKPYFGGDNLFVISTDFSHYPSYEDAQMVDHLTTEAILSKTPEKLLKTLKDNDKKNIYNLATSLCGWTSVLSLLYIIQDNPDMELHQVQYKNSGDAKYYGDKSQVVGYCSIVVTGKDNKQEKQEFSLTEKDKEDLLHIARNTIEEYIKNENVPEIDENKLSDNIKEHCGAFVTLHKDGKLRGCIGRFHVDEPLYKVVQRMAISSSTQDYRFPRVVESEIDELDIEISVLTPMQKINSIDEIELGKHGIYIKAGYSSGTFLPQVATQTGWSKEEFLGHCAKDKAGIGWEGWKNADVYIFEATVFDEKEVFH